MKLLYLLVDTELLDFVVDKVDFPEGIERHEHEGNITVLVAQGLTPNRALRALRVQLQEFGVLLKQQWVDGDTGERLIWDRLSNPLNYTYRYIVVRATTEPGYLGFGGKFIDIPPYHYRIVRIPDEHASWQIQRLASGMNLVQGGNDFASFEQAAAYVMELELEAMRGAD